MSWAGHLKVFWINLCSLKFKFQGGCLPLNLRLGTWSSSESVFAALNLNLRGADELRWAHEALLDQSLQLKPTGYGVGIGGLRDQDSDLLHSLLCDLEEIILE